MNIGLKINLKLLLDIWSLQEAENIKLQFRVINQSEATFRHLEPSGSRKYQITVSCNLNTE